MLTAIEFQPGIVLDDTDSADANQYKDGNNIRFVRDHAEVIGGWELIGGDTFTNPARGAHAWSASTGDRVAAFGTSSTLYAFYGGAIIDITPQKSAGSLVSPFTTVDGSDVVTVADQDHGLKDGDVVTFSNASATVGGLTIDGDYTVKVLTIDSYQITTASAATSSATGGGVVEFSVPLDEGLVDGIGGTGWGTGLYGEGYYGLPTGGDIDPRVWSLDNWGSNLNAVPRNGALYEWQPLASYDDIMSNGDFSSTDDWTAGTGWSIAGGKATATSGTESKLTQDVTGKMSGGVVYTMTIDVTVTAGAMKLQIQSSDLDDSSNPLVYDEGEVFDVTGTYTRRFYAPADPTTLIFLKNSTFAGSINSVSVKVESKAYRIHNAPEYSIGMFIDPNRIVVLYGTIGTSGGYNPLLVRWSDQEDNTVWIADTDNLAGSYTLAKGSRIVGGLAGRGQNLIFTDEALYTMTFTGDTTTVFSFLLVGSGCGLLGKNAAVEHQGSVYWWAKNGQFYIYRGGEPQIIECPIRKTIWANMAPSQQEKVYAAVNSQFKEIWWFYPDKRDGTECSRYVAYNWATNVWFIGVIPRTAWIPAGVYPNPIGFGSSDGMAYYHERGTTANGGVLDWFLETGKFNIQDGDTLLKITRYIPDFQNQVGNINVDFTFWQWPRGPEINAGSYTITPTTAAINFRQLGREASIKWSAGSNNRGARWGTHRLDVDKTGARR